MRRSDGEAPRCRDESDARALAASRSQAAGSRWCTSSPGALPSAPLSSAALRPGEQRVSGPQTSEHFRAILDLRSNTSIRHLQVRGAPLHMPPAQRVAPFGDQQCSSQTACYYHCAGHAERSWTFPGLDGCRGASARHQSSRAKAPVAGFTAKPAKVLTNPIRRQIWFGSSSKTSSRNVRLCLSLLASAQDMIAAMSLWTGCSNPQPLAVQTQTMQFQSQPGILPGRALP